MHSLIFPRIERQTNTEGERDDVGREGDRHVLRQQLVSQLDRLCHVARSA